MKQFYKEDIRVDNIFGALNILRHNNPSFYILDARPYLQNKFTENFVLPYEFSLRLFLVLILILKCYKFLQKCVGFSC